MAGFFSWITNFVNFAEYGVIRKIYFLELFFFHPYSDFQVRTHVHEKASWGSWIRENKIREFQRTGHSRNLLSTNKTCPMVSDRAKEVRDICKV